MDAATTMAYALTIVAGLITKIEIVPLVECDADKSKVCFMIETPCGKAGGYEECLGRADLNEAPAAKPRPKKKHTASRYRRKTSHQSVGQILTKAL